MTKADILTILKSDLDIATASTSKDGLLNNLIDLAQAAITREGITLSQELTVEEGMLVEMYAAYLFRRRKYTETVANGSVTFPRNLRYQLNNMLLQQKAAQDE
jgi:hypothetical protein